MRRRALPLGWLVEEVLEVAPAHHPDHTTFAHGEHRVPGGVPEALEHLLVDRIVRFDPPRLPGIEGRPGELRWGGVTQIHTCV